MAEPAEQNKTPARPAKLNELVVVADFPKPWANDEEEITAMTAGAGSGSTKGWSPSREDFLAVAKASLKFNPPVVSNLGGLVGFMQQHVDKTKKKIDRLVLITHAEPGRVGLGGTIRKSDGATFFGEEDVNDFQATQVLNNNVLGIMNDETLGDRPLRDLIRSLFSPIGEFAIYGCKAAGVGGGPVLKDISDAWDVQVVSFKNFIDYAPQFKTEPKPRVIVNRTRSRYEDRAVKDREEKNMLPGFRHYMPDSIPIRKPSLRNPPGKPSP